MLRRFEADRGQEYNSSFVRKGALVVTSAIAMMPAVFGIASSEAHVQNGPLQETYPQNVAAYDPYGFHAELADRPIPPSGNPERANIERCVNLTLNSLRKYSFQTSRDGRKVKESIKADSVEECVGVVDRNIDVHFDMDRMAPRDTVDNAGDTIKEIGLDPNSKVKVYKSEGSINHTGKMRLFHKLTPKIDKKRRKFQMVVGVNATDNSTGEIYRESHKAKIKYAK
ncbi:MAG: hypothetical protein AAB914_02445 [Patescibacteria group bacterium]